MSYSIHNRPSQNVPLPPNQQVHQPALEESTQRYTREQLKEDLKNRDAKSKPYSARPGETAWGFEKEQMNNQGYTGVQKKRGIRGLFASDHAKGAEKEARKEMFHAEKAERYAVRSRDPALTDRQRRKYLRKAAKQQASADFHESLKKKHIIGSTPGHKYQAVPAMATHHPVIHDNATNTVRCTVNDQVFAPSRIQVGPAAFDGFSEVGSRQDVVPHPAVANVSTNIKPQQKWKGQVSADRKLSKNQPPYVSTGHKHALPKPIIGADPFIAREQEIKQQQPHVQYASIQQYQEPAIIQHVEAPREVNNGSIEQHAQRVLPFDSSDLELQSHLIRGESAPRDSTWLYSFPMDDDYSSEDEDDHEEQSRDLQVDPVQHQSLPFGAADLQGINLKPTSEQRDIQIQPVQQNQALPFSIADLQGASLKPRYEQREALPFASSDLQGAHLKSTKVQHEALPFGASELQQGAKGLNESQPWRTRKLPFTGAYLREGARRLQHASTVERNGMWLNAGQLSSQSKKLNRVTPRERGVFNISGPALRGQREMLNRAKTVERRAVALPSAKAITAQRKNLKAATTRERSSFFIPAAAHLRSTRGKLNKIGNPTSTYNVVVSEDLQVPKNTKQARTINFSKMGQAKSQQPSMLTTINNFVTNLFSGNTAEAQ